MKYILVTGASGFIGSNLIRVLLNKGNNVIGIDNFITSNGDNLKSLQKFKRFTFIKYDITKPFSQSIKSKVLNIHSIYHLACPTGVPNLSPLAEEMLLSCSLGTINILNLARETDSKLLFTSSSEIYGNPREFPQKESYTGNVDPIGFRSPYEEGKRFSESLIIMYVRKYNLDAKIARVFNTFGPGSSPTETRVVPRFIHLALSNKPITVEGDGHQTRTFCYIDDLVEGVITVMKKGESGEVYNMGSNEEIPIIQVAKLILNYTNSKSKIQFVKRPLHDHDRRLPDLTKIKKLGWKPKISLKEGLSVLLSKK